MKIFVHRLDFARVNPIKLTNLVVSSLYLVIFCSFFVKIIEFQDLILTTVDGSVLKFRILFARWHKRAPVRGSEH